MVPKRKKAVSFSGKLVLFFMVLLSISSLLIGFTGYYIARNELNKKGEIILKNSVLQALYLIESEHSKVQNGLIPEDESKENLKKILSGPMDPETKTRKLSHKIDLGKNGYFIIYNSEGDEIMHPSLEGQNVLEVKDFGNKEHFLVKEQIKTGKNNGGFVYYSWWLPHKKKIAKKVSYCNYYEPWDWIVVATSYKVDFNKATNIILLVLIITILFLVFLVSIIIIRYIRKITKPIIEIVHGMDMVGKNSFEAVQETPYNDEISLLING